MFDLDPNVFIYVFINSISPVGLLVPFFAVYYSKNIVLQFDSKVVLGKGLQHIQNTFALKQDCSLE